MKKVLSFFLTLFFFALIAFSQEATSFEDISQVLIPRDVFIGDLGQIKYSFRCDIDFFSLFPSSLINDDTMTLPLSSSDFLEDAESALIKDALLIRNGDSYTLLITIIPWKIGTIHFKEFSVESLFSEEETFENKFSVISLEPVTILSLVEKMSVKELRPPEPPFVLPKTNYFLWALGILLTGSFAFLCVLALRFPNIIQKWKEFREKRVLYKNAKKTKKKLLKLLKKDISDKSFSEYWQKVLRCYLEFRFKSPFSSVVAKRIGEKILGITDGFISEKTMKAIENLTCFFIRTDYIRFASGSIDSTLLPAESHKASFLEGERKSLVKETCMIIETLENGGEGDV